jgi:hypothetical protein
MVLLLAFYFASRVSAAEVEALTFADVVQRAVDDPVLLARTAGLARLQGEVAATGGFTREGPTLQTEVGPRRTQDGARKLEALARLEIPFLSGRRARAEADSQLRDTSADTLAADTVESRLRLRTAFLDAWLEQERVEVLDRQLQASEQILASVRKRVEEGAEAPYEVALVEGDSLRTRSDSDAARAALGEAWTALRALADLPPQPQKLASPGIPELNVPGDVEPRFDAGLLRRAVGYRESLETAVLDLEQAKRRSRWSASATVAKEADESFATVGVAYRFPNSGEAAAFDRARATAVAAIDRVADVEAARLATRFETIVDRAKRFGPITLPDAFDDALRAVALRMDLGKERPSIALPVRRQLLEARSAAMQRIRDAHVLMAELDALVAGDAR